MERIMKETLGWPPIEKMSDKVLDGATIIFLKYFLKKSVWDFPTFKEDPKILGKTLVR